MRRVCLLSVRVGVVLLVGVVVAFLLLRNSPYLSSFRGHDSVRSSTAKEASLKSDDELLRAVAAGEAPWDFAELKTRCETYSTDRLDEIVESIVDMAFTMDEGNGPISPGPNVYQFLQRVRDFLPPSCADTAVQSAAQKRLDVQTELEEYVRSQCSPDGSHTQQDVERLYQICRDLDDPSKYPQIADSGCFGSLRASTRSQAIQALTCCGAFGLEKLRQLGEPESVLAVALARTGRSGDVEELLALCRNPENEEDRLGCLTALAGLDRKRRTEATQETLRSELPTFFENPDPTVRTRAVYAAGRSEDPFFLSALDSLAANDPYHETDKRAHDGVGVSIEQTYERYGVRENAAQAAETIRMADPEHVALLEVEQERRRRLNEIFNLESNAIHARTTMLNASHDARPGPEYTDPPPWREDLARRLAVLAGEREKILEDIAERRAERARLLGEPDLSWSRTETGLIKAIAAGDESASEVLGRRCALCSEEWLEETALLMLDAEVQAGPHGKKYLLAAADSFLPDRVRGPMAEYRLARDGDDKAKDLFAAKVRAGMTTGRLMVTMVHQLYLDIEDPRVPESAALAQSYADAVLSHGQRALFVAPSFLIPPGHANSTPEDLVPEDVSVDQKERLLEYRRLRAKVYQIDARLAVMDQRDWVIPAIKDQRTEARRRMDVLWRELHRAAREAVGE